MVRLDLTDIQGNILRGYKFPSAVHLFLTIPDARGGRRFLRETVDEIQNAENWENVPQTATNIALTYAGLQALDVDDTILSALPSAFREPIRRRAPRVLDDTGPSEPECWRNNLGTGTAHLLVMVAGSSRNEQDALTEAVGALERRMKSLGLEEAHRQDVNALPDAREHFGWADGFGQPAIEGVPGNRAGQGVPQEDGQGWRDLKAGEFILGYPDEDGQCLSGPPLLRNGSYMVYRKLRQDVPLFTRLLSEEAQRYGKAVGLDCWLDPHELFELMAAKLVGRWRDGVAIELVDRRTKAETCDLASKAEELPDNNFRYSADADGFRCPKGAHIRRTNPRDAGGGGTMASRHRIIRRGMPYEEHRPENHDDGEKGLIFICFNADFERQFETVQAQWCNDGNAFGLGDAKDYLVGSNSGAAKVTVQGQPPYFARADPGIVLTRGCEYLLMPGITALRDLANPRRGLGRR